MARITPPEDISPEDFFTRWIPAMVREDEERRRRLGNTQASIVFAFAESEHGAYTVHICGGEVRGEASPIENPDLVVRVDIETWRRLNRGDLSAPEAALRRRVRLEGDLILALKLHLILG
jgi:putative sterol carrier protein